MKSKAQISRSLHSDINDYMKLKEEMELLKDTIKMNMDKLEIRDFETELYEVNLTEVSRGEVDAESFHKGLSKSAKKNFLKMVNVVKGKAKKFVTEDYIDEHYFITTTFDRLDGKAKSKKRKVYKKKG